MPAGTPNRRQLHGGGEDNRNGHVRTNRVVFDQLGYIQISTRRLFQHE